jgi:hypothetical protein
MTSLPDCSKGGASRFGRTSPGSSRLYGFASTFTQAGDGAPGQLASIASIQSTIVGTGA